MLRSHDGAYPHSCHAREIVEVPPFCNHLRTPRFGKRGGCLSRASRLFARIRRLPVRSLNFAELLRFVLVFCIGCGARIFALVFSRIVERSEGFLLQGFSYLLRGRSCRKALLPGATVTSEDQLVLSPSGTPAKTYEIIVEGGRSVLEEEGDWEIAIMSAAINQMLSNFLSARGPEALPYGEESKWTIREQVCKVLSDYPSLKARKAPFTHNDGQHILLLQLEGTIPMYYQGRAYNIPVGVWLLEGFPRAPPLLFVTPTRDMVIKPGHSFVDASGVVDIPYLREWTYPRSNLSDLVSDCSALFGKETPLYSSSSLTHPIQPNPNLQGYDRPQFSGGNPMHNMHGTPYPGQPPAYSPSPVPAPVPSAASDRGVSRYIPNIGNSMPSIFMGGGGGAAAPPVVKPKAVVDPEEAFKAKAIQDITERLKKDLTLRNKEVHVEVEQRLATQQNLNQRAEAIDRGLRELHGEKEGLEHQLQVMLTNADVLDRWLQANDKGDLEVDIDTAFEPADVLSKQLLEATAHDLAIEDVLYSLDKAMQEDEMDQRQMSVDAYLKSVRTLCKEQFVHRALGLKIQHKQREMQIGMMAIRSGRTY
eukprot:TRINITY_DN458_c0_g1_i1.p1 TRINITY_DN458_c0_g1~~TRINITY_DN458_c0_g1_i1.p1  ORF type:complete len:591 (+),score=45.54 TRINITY_DN458_c0_g1_i1:122-1894(+)